MYERRATTATPTTDPIAISAMAPFESPPLPLDTGVDDAVVLAVCAEGYAIMEAGVEAGSGDVAGVDEAADELAVV